MAGLDFGFDGQGEKPGADGVDDLIEVATGQVGAADAAGEERVSGDKQLERGKVETDGALGVAGGVKHLCGAGFQAYALAVGEGFVGRSCFRGCDAQPGGLLVHDFQLRQIVFVEQDGRAGEALELEGAADVVDVAVGDENLLELEAKLVEAAMDAADLFAGIDDDGLAGLLVTENGAVALQRADGEGFENHALIVGPAVAAGRRCVRECAAIWKEKGVATGRTF